MQILIVMVRYKMALDQSDTISGLCQTFERRPDLLKSVGLLIWDNSPLQLENPQLPIPFEYRHTGENLGVSGAYNRAMEIADALGCPWLLLLDQDTTLPDNFIARMLDYSREQQQNEDIAAIAPFLLDGDRTISPGILLPHRVRLMAQPFSGVHRKEVYAANSGTLMRVSALREIGGYDEAFWLDLSDIVAFHQLHRKEKRLYIAGDLQLQHKVTLNDYDGSMSPERYLNFITAEGAYWDSYRPAFQNAIQTARLLARAVRQYYRYANKAYSRITWKYFLQRLFSPKQMRLNQWRRQSSQRNIPAISNGQTVNN